MNYWVGKAAIVEPLLLGEYGRITIFEVDVFPPKALSSFVAPVSQYLCASHAGVREEVDQSAVTRGFDCCLSVFTDVVDGTTGLLVDEAGELLTVFGGPRLLVTALVITVVGDRLGCVAPLSDVLGEVALADGPPQNAETYA